MEKEIFGFKVTDNDRPDSHNDEYYMFYLHLKNLLVPIYKEFSKGFMSPVDVNQAIASLKEMNIKSLTTFCPNLETVVSLPYEITNEEDFRACEADGLWNRFDHSEIYQNSDLGKLMKESGINLKILNSKKIEELNKKLEYYEKN